MKMMYYVANGCAYVVIKLWFLAVFVGLIRCEKLLYCERKLIRWVIYERDDVLYIADGSTEFGMI